LHFWLLYFCQCGSVTQGRSESRTSLNARDQESKMESHDLDKQSMQANIDQLENDKKHLLADLRHMAEKLANGEILFAFCSC